MLNINVGVLGHVDSGKTTLSRALSTIASTAAFDKNPQSQKRGITLDLGFSSFKIDKGIPCHLAPAEAIQITLVDCPGHASLIRTIICGAHIIDLMLLVLDINKGFQTQTAECLIIGELTCEALVVVLNKTDLVDEDKRNEKVAKMKSRVAKTLESTKFKNAPIVAVSALQNEKSPDDTGLAELVTALLLSIRDPRPKRRELETAPFLFAVDHCFSKSGQGTVMTGTVLRGCARVGDIVEIPHCKLTKKIKSMQMFHSPVEAVGPGDRAGVCVTQVDPGVMERGFLAAPDSLGTCQACLLVDVARIAYFKGPVRSKQLFHVSVGQETLLARITLVRRCDKAQKEEFEYVEELVGDESDTQMLLEFEGANGASAAVVAVEGGTVIGARLDFDPLSPACRLAFHGRVARIFASTSEYRPTVTKTTSSAAPKAPPACALPVYRHKQRRGEVERVVDARHCIVRGLFKRETNWDIFTGLRVTVSQDDPTLPTSIAAVVEGSFGQSGKCRIRLSSDLPESLVKRFSGKAGKKAAATAEGSEPSPAAKASGAGGPLVVTLNFKKHVFDPTKRFVQ